MCTWAYRTGVSPSSSLLQAHTSKPANLSTPIKRLHTGVGSQEYTEVLSQLFVPEGNRLFQGAGKWADKWQLQQDNARPHTTDANKAYIEANVPGRRFPAWPANSPDLSPIENMWAWMEGKLHKEYKPHNIEELKECLEQIRQSIPLSMVRTMFDNYEARMRRVIDCNGAYINK